MGYFAAQKPIVQHISMKFFAGIFILIFIVFAILQWNDPDPWFWIPAYLLSAYTAYAAFRNYYNPMLLMVMVMGYFIAAIALFPEGSISEWLHQEDQAASLEMKMPFVEEARESLGLMICFVVNLIFMLVGMKKAKKPGYNLHFLFKQEPNKRSAGS
jgi:hypothetical protein